MKYLMHRDDVFVVDFDQCCFCLRPPDAYAFEYDVRVRKPTGIVTNMAGLQKLGCRCDGSHVHIHALGSTLDKSGKRVKRSATAAAYPPALCRRWSSLVLAHLRDRSEEGEPAGGRRA